MRLVKGTESKFAFHKGSQSKKTGAEESGSPPPEPPAEEEKKDESGPEPESGEKDGK